MTILNSFNPRFPKVGSTQAKKFSERLLQNYLQIESREFNEYLSLVLI